MGMSLWQIASSLLAVAAVTLLIVRDYRRAIRKKAQAAGRQFDLLLPHVEDVRIQPQPAAGSEILTGRIGSRRVDIRTVTDTLALRKLPSLWLMITLPGPTGVTSTLDLMMRAAGQASFSNFDRLTDTLPHPAGFPDEALLKSDDEEAAPSPDVLRPLLSTFTALRGKEILVTPKGVRMVIQIAEGDRARYGVFRQAHFQPPMLQPELILSLVEDLAALLDRLSVLSGNEAAEDLKRRAVHG